MQGVVAQVGFGSKTRKQNLNAVNRSLVSSADTEGAFNTGLDTVNLRLPSTTLEMGDSHGAAVLEDGSVVGWVRAETALNARVVSAR